MGYRSIYVLALAPLAIAGSLQAASYTATDLGALGGSANLSWSASINNSGQVAGYSGPNISSYYAAVFSGGTITAIPTPATNLGTANAINDSGTVAGTYYYDATPQAFIYSGGVTQEINIVGSNLSIAAGINNAGYVVGTAKNTLGQFRGFIYDGTDTTLLPTLGGNASYANAINNSNQVTGYSKTSGGDNHAFIYTTAGGMTDLGALASGASSYGQSINDSGKVVGYSGMDAWNINRHAFLYDGTTMIDLGTLAGDIDSVAYDINNSGVIVGSSDGANTKAIIYIDGTMYDLNTLVDIDGVNLTAAMSINDAGQITAIGQYADLTFHAFILDPVTVPEPATITALTLGAATLMLRRKR